MRGFLALLLVAVTLIVPQPASAAVSGPPKQPDPIAHDPTVIKQGRYYYAFITGDIATRTYLPMKRSTDLVHWTELGPVFRTAPAWVTQELGLTPGDFWAPDITYFDGAFHLYYAASSFGTNNSVIGLATNKTLDPASPDYGWVDHGMVVRSSPADNFNAIDPDVVFADGRPWLAFGSFWDGIKMRRLDAATGMLSPADSTLYSLASRGGASIEGASITRHGRYYYLFVSFDFCCRGVNSDYRVAVGRSTSVTGPYVDRSGVPMLAGGGTELLRGYNEFRGPGGGDVFANFYVHHYYDATDNGAPKLSVRPINWAGGWPSLGDPLSGSLQVGHGPAYTWLINRRSGAVVSTPTCGYEGADIRLDTMSDSPCQQWRGDDRGSGFVSVLNRFSNKVAEVAACINAEGARVAQWGWLDNDCQQFQFVSGGDGWSTVTSKLNGRVWQPAACGGVGAAIQTATADGSACQQFRIQPVGNVLIADAAMHRVLSALPGVRMTDRHPNGCQLWHFASTSDAYYHIVDACTGRDLTVHNGHLTLGRPGPAAEWRVDPTATGTYQLVDRTGTSLDEVRLLAP
jgi:arabinan endo-1,5-alpha-L-arabinosidase